MDDIALKMIQLAGKGYSCSQIPMLLALDARGEQNPALVRAIGGLAYGCGSSRGTCGIWTGGSCVLALFAGKGSDEERESERYMVMLEELSDWFSDRMGGNTAEPRARSSRGKRGRQRPGRDAALSWRKPMPRSWTSSSPMGLIP
jgi:hypothetical protein